jgi:hypothetical protein
MQADYAIELGAADATLDFPWASPDGGPRYFDLKRYPELISQVEEAVKIPELAGFLLAVNAASAPLESAKCDAWSSSEMDPEEEIFGAAWKFGSYVDLVFSGEERFSFAEHEKLVKRLVELLKRAPEIPALVEFMVRRGFFGRGNGREGFYLTFYLFGYSKDAENARRQWGIALKLAENAIRQVCSEQVSRN